MINKETIISSFDDKSTLLKWLKKVEAALKNASAVSFNVNKRGDATLTFSIVFDDGSEIVSDPIVLQQGESVESAAIVDGHLILTLTNGDELDAGLLFNGDLNINGNIVANSFRTTLFNGFVEPSNASDRVDADVAPTLSEAATNAGITIPFFHERVSNGKLSIVCLVNFPKVSTSGQTFSGNIFPTNGVSSPNIAYNQAARVFNALQGSGIIAAVAAPTIYASGNISTNVVLTLQKTPYGLTYRLVTTGSVNLSQYEGLSARLEMNFIL